MAFMMKVSLASFSALAFLQSHWMVAAMTNEEKETRNLIIGGENAQPGEFPFFAAGVGCGGSLIHEDIVLTAAHCSDNLTPFGDLVQIGGTISPFVNNSTELLDGEIIPTVCVLNHPDYVPLAPGMGRADIALVKLARPSNNSKPIELNFDVNVPLVNESVTTVGYGISTYTVLPRQNSTGIFPENLQVFKRFRIQSEDVCRFIDPEDFSPDSHLCANDNDPVSTTCPGDSGGPLLTEDGVQVGVVSYVFFDPATGECNGFLPNYHTNVAKFKSFIENGICGTCF